MTANILDGEAAAAAVASELTERVGSLIDRGVTPGVGTILVGDDGPSAKYVAMKHRDAQLLGLASTDVRLDRSATREDVLAAVRSLNADPAVDAFIVQYPLPVGLDFGEVMLAVDPAKDADGLHPVNLGLLVMGSEAPLACTPAGIVRLLTHHGIDLDGAHVVVVGRGLTIGRPLANLLALKSPGPNAAVTVVHTGVSNLADHLRRADVVIAAAGSPGLIRGDMLSEGVVAVGAGVSFADGSLVSDLADDVADVAAWVTPRIGGVGPMTRIMLMANTVAAAERQLAV